MENEITLNGEKYRKVEEKKKQDIRAYCREHRVWAVKTERGTIHACASEPHLIFLDNQYWEYVKNTRLDESKFIFPDCPWNKSLIAPDGSMPLMEKKHQPYYGRFATESSYGWIVGHLYVDDTKFSPRECLEITRDGEAYLSPFPKEHDCLPYRWNPSKYKDIGKKPATQKPHRGDPIFVWDDDTPDTIPGHIEYFHHFDGDVVVDFSWEIFGQPCERWEHYRLFDASLVGVPRKDWPEA